MSASAAVHPRRCSAILLALLNLFCAAAASLGVTPQATPDPHVAGFSFPVSEATLTEDIAAMNRGDETAASRIYRHAWGLWAAVTRATTERYDNQRLRVFETWASVDDLLNAEPTSSTAAPSKRVLTPRRLSQLRLQLDGDRERDASDDGSGVIGAIKFDPSAANHITQQRLLQVSALDTLLANGAIQVPPFPVTALIVKPVYRIVRRADLVAGRYYFLRVWSGPPATPQGFGPDDWPSGVWIDLRGGGNGRGQVDAVPAVDGSSRTAETTYSVDTFIHHRLSADDASVYNAANPDAHTAAGDTALLVAMHIAGRELARWTWQTFWWTPDAAQPPTPSSAALAAQRPTELDPAAGHYAMTLAYTMLAPDQPFTGGSNNAPAVYAYNPWIEAHFTPGDLPDSTAGLAPDGSPSANNTGVQTNCMSCHAQATYHRPGAASAPRFTGARYVDLGDPQFVGNLQTDFLWALARHAR